MKKSSVFAMFSGTASGIMFALGMCMVLLVEWNLQKSGIIIGSIGIILGLITLLIWRKMEKKPPIKIDRKIALRIAVAIAGALILGVGMCLCMIWNRMVIGSLIGIAGILVLLALIPMIKGIK